ncbi:MAG: retron St85 family RNA-directed DNA polymerase [Candidatus Sericytochromatia bacterium]
MTTLQQRWQEIVRAGGIDAYIEKQLTEQGFLVTRREVDGMNPRQLKEYKDALRKESEEKKKLKKETWMAYQASHICYLGDGIFWQDKPYEDKFDLKQAEERRAANELPALDNPRQLAEALGLTMGQLRWLCFHREAAESLHYTHFEIPKRSGGMRRIWAPRPKLKQAQRWILQNILEQLPVHGAAHGFLPERSILSNARVHVDSKRLIRLDLKDYFPTITQPRVKGVFRKAGYREQVATLLALLCTEAPREIQTLKDKTYYVALGERCLPQGAPTSPALSNIVSMSLDRRLQGLCDARGWRYSRYADDLSFSLPDGDSIPQVGYMLGAVKRIVEAEGFELNRKKTWVARKGGKQAVTGLLVNGEGPPRVARELKRRLRATIHNLKQGKGLHEGETIHQVVGYSAYVAMVEPELGKAFLNELYPFVPKP